MRKKEGTGPVRNMKSLSESLLNTDLDTLDGAALTHILYDYLRSTKSFLQGELDVKVKGDTIFLNMSDNNTIRFGEEPLDPAIVNNYKKIVSKCRLYIDGKNPTFKNITTKDIIWIDDDYYRDYTLKAPKDIYLLGPETSSTGNRYASGYSNVKVDCRDLHTAIEWADLHGITGKADRLYVKINSLEKRMEGLIKVNDYAWETKNGEPHYETDHSLDKLLKQTRNKKVYWVDLPYSVEGSLSKHLKINLDAQYVQIHNNTMVRTKIVFFKDPNKLSKSDRMDIDHQIKRYQKHSAYPVYTDSLEEMIQKGLLPKTTDGYYVWLCQ